MAIHSSILAWKIPWTEEPWGLQSRGSQRVGHDLATKQQQLHPLLSVISMCIHGKGSSLALLLAFHVLSEIQSLPLEDFLMFLKRF